MSKRVQTGGSTIRLIVVLAIVVAIVYVGLQIVPVYMSNFQLKDYITDQAMHAPYDGLGDGAIQKNIVNHAQSLSLPVSVDDVQVTHLARGINIVVDFDVPVQLPVHPVTLHFHDHSSNRSII